MKSNASKVLICLVWLFFMVKGAAAVLVLPQWGGFDEWLHYSYVSYLYRTGDIPSNSVASVPEEVHDSLRIAPGKFSDHGSRTFREFWELPAGERQDAISSLRVIRNDRESNFTLSSWQAQHPPLYYVILRPVFGALDGVSLVRSVQVLRLFSLLLVSLALIPAFHILRMFMDETSSIMGLLLFAAFPATFNLYGHITNDALAVSLFMWVIYVVLTQFKRGISRIQSVILGLLMGAGILTKLTVLTALPVVFLVYVYRFLKGGAENRREIVLSFVIFLTLALLISAPWFAHNIDLYGTWNPTVHSAAVKDMGFWDKLANVGRVDWKSFAFSNLIGILWSGNWSFVSFPPAIYKLFGLFLVLSGIGFVRTLVRMKADRERTGLNILLALFSVFFLLGMFQHQVHIRAAGNLDPMGGWYWSALLPTHIALFIPTLSFYAGKRFPIALVTLLITSWVLSFWAHFGMLMPFYTGLLTKQQIAGSLFNGFSLSEALARISTLNSLPTITIPALMISEIVIMCAVLIRSINPGVQPRG